MLLAAVKMAFLAVTPAGFSYGLVGGEIENATAVPTIEQKEFSNLQKKKKDNLNTKQCTGMTAEKAKRDYSVQVLRYVYKKTGRWRHINNSHTNPHKSLNNYMHSHVFEDEPAAEVML